MIKFYKVEKRDILLVIDTVSMVAAPFRLNGKPVHDLAAMYDWWGCASILDGGYNVYSASKLVACIIDGIKEIK